MVKRLRSWDDPRLVVDDLKRLREPGKSRADGVRVQVGLIDRDPVQVLDRLGFGLKGGDEFRKRPESGGPRADAPRLECSVQRPLKGLVSERGLRRSQPAAGADCLHVVLELTMTLEWTVAVVIREE